ncbi:uncharacterized protein EI90DRAFT_3063697, partial [Cantharellus anzutake]|uniref:uncharacterized protein n=1 Tax=Cantharellus anzutake TaxID=1750568 RepID=UPI001902F274
MSRLPKPGEYSASKELFTLFVQQNVSLAGERTNDRPTDRYPVVASDSVPITIDPNLVDTTTCMIALLRDNNASL